MSERNSIRRRFTARLERLTRSAGGLVVSGIIALTALGIDSQVIEATAATCAAALTLGGLLLVRTVAVRRASSEPSKSLAQSKRARVRPCDFVDRNHR